MTIAGWIIFVFMAVCFVVLYVLFDFDGKRYTYYNCFIESIAEIGR